jgi:hypothetical protein
MAGNTRSNCNCLMNPMEFILLCLAGWINREQQAVIEYLSEEIRVLKEIHGKRPRFNDAQRRRLAVKVKKYNLRGSRRVGLHQNSRRAQQLRV